MSSQIIIKDKPISTPVVTHIKVVPPPIRESYGVAKAEDMKEYVDSSIREANEAMKRSMLRDLQSTTGLQAQSYKTRVEPEEMVGITLFYEDPAQLPHFYILVHDKLGNFQHYVELIEPDKKVMHLLLQNQAKVARNVEVMYV